MKYRCVATSVEGFIQQLAVAYITHGYWFYVAGEIPEGKDPAAIDTKLIARYGIAISKWARCRRKKQGLASMQYLRHERFFVLLATTGRHEFFERERASIRDARRVPIRFAGYTIGCRKGRSQRWHACVRMDASVYQETKAWALNRGMQRSDLEISRLLRDLPFQRYEPVRRQLCTIHRAVNQRRALASFPLVQNALDHRRQPVRVFDDRTQPVTLAAAREGRRKCT